jgi:hypothetical protein
MEETIRRVLQSIEFTRYLPLQPIQQLNTSMSTLPVRIDSDSPLDVLNTNILFPTPLGPDHPLHQIPRMATIATSVLINELVRNMPAGTSFVNVGVWNGYTFLSGLVDNADRVCIGIDNFSEFGGPREAFLANYKIYQSSNSQFHELDYRNYFREQHGGPIGLYLYDGAHDYRSQLEALEIAHRHIAIGGTILVDDTNWADPFDATVDFLKFHRDDYEMVLDRRTAQNGHPTFWNGLMALVRIR